MNDRETAETAQVKPVPDPKPEPDPAPVDPAPVDEGIRAAVKALLEDGQTLVQAELAYRKAQATFGLGEAKTIGLLLVLGLILGFFALFALVVGLLLALAASLGVWGALGVVAGTLAVLAALCLLLGVKRIGRMKAALTGKGRSA